MQGRRALHRAAGSQPRAHREPYIGFCFTLFCAVTLLAVMQPRLVHWFLIPVLACGCVCGRDVLGWFSGRLDPFDPRGIIGVVGMHLFFLAPLLLVYWDMEYDTATRPDDWRPWLGILSAINVGGLLIYRWFERVVFHRRPRRSPRWTIDQDRVFAILIPALLLSGVAQLYLWYRFGGIVGQLENYKSGDFSGVRGRFKYQLLASAFPILLLFLLTALRARGDRNRGRYSMAFFILGLTFVLYFITDGLRGSRSAIIWTLFWATGIIHYFWRRLSARVLLAGLVPLFVFMYTYGLYKSYGSRVIDVYEQSRSLTEMSERSGRTSKRLLVRDLSRTDVQAFMIYRLLSDHSEYQLELGATYAETLPRMLLPSWIWRGRPKLPRKALAGARLHYGAYAPPAEALSKVYGLLGESMLNFHLLGVPIAFALFGMAMGLYRRARSTWAEGDARLFMAPFFAIWFLAAMVGDFDNLLLFTMTKGLFPAFVLLLLVRRQRT